MLPSRQYCGSWWMTWLRRMLPAAAAVLVLSGAAAAAPEPKLVVFLQAATTQREAMARCLQQFSLELERLWEQPVTVMTEDVFSPLSYHEKLYEWTAAKYKGRKVDLIVVFEGLGSIQGIEFRSRLWPETPLLVTGIGSARFKSLIDLNNATAVTMDQDIPAFLASAYRLLPDARRLVFISGIYYPSEKEQAAWTVDAAEFARSHGLSFQSLSGVPMSQAIDTLKSASPDTLVLFRDPVTGGSRRPGAQTLLAEATGTPVFAALDAQPEEGAAGTLTVDYSRLGEEIAAHAVRVLQGPNPTSVPPLPSRAFVTAWDWRQLQRWRLDERRLPEGADVRFRRPGLWEAHRTAMLAITGTILVQGLLITGLLVQRSRRRQAEALLHRERSQLAHTQRVATVNQLTAALAHELNQPITAMVNNAGAARRLLAGCADQAAAECQEILRDIEADGHHAGGLLRTTRDMLRPAAGDAEPAGMTALIEAAKRLTAPECTARGCTVTVHAAAGLPEVAVNPVQIQQVLVNLLVNALEAATSPGAFSRDIRIDCAADHDGLSVSVRDFGPGLPEGDPARWFGEFQTTKPDGIGMGLAVSRTIIEAHGGKIRAENAVGGGACFTFSLPAKSATPP